MERHGYACAHVHTHTHTHIPNIASNLFCLQETHVQSLRGITLSSCRELNEPRKANLNSQERYWLKKQTELLSVLISSRLLLGFLSSANS